MIRIRFAGIAVAAAAVCGAAAWTVTGSPSSFAGSPASFVSPSASFAGSPDPVGDVPGAAAQSASPQRREENTSRSGSGARPRPHGAPAPFVQQFAAQPGRARVRPQKSPKTPVKVAPTVDGCDRNYGTQAQCIPLVYPTGVTDHCAWLAAHGFTHIKVVGKDRQKLDADGNGTACG
ncbi:hypothetical protein ACWT_4018 [Actinoplanes sp. SE50]|uniref:hypothetical protein n=1 Tax=unclassified Actinoplanes TaxID=2626549 RepID=UPI00023EBBA5|nr:MULTISPECIES: hypothetical protein [unclassified Actinoplanes]AEV85042.1 hypothetical protein ACPL_4147 [Actinoplanes sp. SE50/110]ATO83433.1 hypothetical protein ACWT_4018 [Actinoplanes sp. SE50]SLM00840.1 hypothetical protein ACSP50_4073 [Actinoplanes sp. SE50/110]